MSARTGIRKTLPRKNKSGGIGAGTRRSARPLGFVFLTRGGTLAAGGRRILLRRRLKTLERVSRSALVGFDDAGVFLLVELREPTGVAVKAGVDEHLHERGAMVSELVI